MNKNKQTKNKKQKTPTTVMLLLLSQQHTHQQKPIRQPGLPPFKAIRSPTGLVSENAMQPKQRAMIMVSVGPTWEAQMSDQAVTGCYLLPFSFGQYSMRPFTPAQRGKVHRSHVERQNCHSSHVSLRLRKELWSSSRPESLHLQPNTLWYLLDQI